MILIDHLVVFISHSILMGGKLAKNSIKSVFGSSQHGHSIDQYGMGSWAQTVRTRKTRLDVARGVTYAVGRASVPCAVARPGGAAGVRVARARPGRWLGCVRPGRARSCIVVTMPFSFFFFQNLN